MAADPRTPRRARWWLIGLAIYIASPIDLIPDFLPVIGHLDEVILVPIILRHIRAMIPNEVWESIFAPIGSARQPPGAPGPSAPGAPKARPPSSTRALVQRVRPWVEPPREEAVALSMSRS